MFSLTDTRMQLQLTASFQTHVVNVVRRVSWCPLDSVRPQPRKMLQVSNRRPPGLVFAKKALEIFLPLSCGNQPVTYVQSPFQVSGRDEGFTLLPSVSGACWVLDGHAFRCLPHFHPLCFCFSCKNIGGNWASQVTLEPGKEPACHCRRHKGCMFNPWVGRIPWTRAWQFTLFLLVIIIFISNNSLPLLSKSVVSITMKGDLFLKRQLFELLYGF